MQRYTQDILKSPLPSTQRDSFRRRSMMSRTIDHETPPLRNPQTIIFNSLAMEHKQTLEQLRPVASGKCNMLEDWLNEALSDESIQREFNKEALSTVRRYFLDRRQLRNTNVPEERIKKMYTSLFVYSQGIKRVFQDLLAIGDPSNRDKMVHHYWGAFMKLIENASPVKMSFQLLQKRYLEEIRTLKAALIQTSHREEQGINQSESLLKKKNKELEELSKKYQNVQADFLIADSTLKLTEDNFNTQVALRLKFQEKINAVYSTHNEIKTKYEQLKFDLGVKINSLEDQELQFRTLHEHLISQRIINKELELKLANIGVEMNRKELELQMVRQEMVDMKKAASGDSKEQSNTEDIIQHQSNTLKALALTVKEKDAQMVAMNDYLHQLEDRNKREKGLLGQCRDKNDDLYLKCHDLEQRIAPLLSIQATLEQQFSSAKKRLIEMQQICKQADDECVRTRQRDKELQGELEDARKELGDRLGTILSNTSLIEELKGVKGKYEMMNELLRGELAQANESIAHHNKLLSRQVNNSYSLECHVSKLKESLSLLQIDRDKDREDFGRMQCQYANNVDIRDKNLSVLQASLEELKRTLKEKESTLTETTERLRVLENKELKEADQRAYLSKLAPTLEQEKQTLTSQINGLHSRLQMKENQIGLLRSKLGGKELALDKKSNQITNEIASLHESLRVLREQLHLRAAYVHPLVLEDARAYVIRLREQAASNAQSITKMSQEVRSKEAETGTLRQLSDSIQAELAYRKKECVELKKENASLKREMRQSQLKKEGLIAEERREHEEQLHRLKEKIEQSNQGLRVMGAEKIALQVLIGHASEERTSLVARIEQLQKERGRTSQAIGTQTMPLNKAEEPKESKQMSKGGRGSIMSRGSARSSAKDNESGNLRVSICVQEIKQTEPPQLPNRNQSALETSNDVYMMPAGDIRSSLRQQSAEEQADNGIALRVSEHGLRRKKVESHDYKRALRLSYLRK